MESTEKAGGIQQQQQQLYQQQQQRLLQQDDGKDKTRFRKPFKVYENFRNVYKGVRKTRTTSSQYNVAATEDLRSTENFAGSSSNDESSSSSSSSDLGLGISEAACIVVSVNALNSLETSLGHCGSPSPRSDGNTTDDSGIDSICDRLINDTEKKSAIAAFALEEEIAEVKSSPGAKAKTMLHDTYGSLKRQTTKMDNPWKRDFVLLHSSSASGSNGKLRGSKEDLLMMKSTKKGDNVELTSVRSKVKDTVQAIETRYGGKIESPPSPKIPIYSTINLANKKNKRNVVEHAPEQKSDGNKSSTGKISLSSIRFPIEEEVADIAEITQLLSNTNDLLNRSSHLRASLTVSVRHPNKKTAQTTTFVFPTNNSNNMVNNKKKESCNKKKPKAQKSQGIWNNFLYRKSKEDLTKDSDDETSSSNDDKEVVVEKSTSVHQTTTTADKGISRYEEANARIAAKFEMNRDAGASKEELVSDDPNSVEVHEDVDYDEDERLEETATPFARHNPARRGLGPGATVDIRRSVRLAPKTVANLASKFDNLLVSDTSKPTVKDKVDRISVNPTVEKKTILPEKELKLCKKDISKIIDALNKLEDESKKSTAVTSKPIAKPRTTVVTSSRFTTSGVGRKSLRQKQQGMSLAVKTGVTKNGELSKKNSMRKPGQDQPRLVEKSSKREDEITATKHEVSTKPDNQQSHQNAVTKSPPLLPAKLPTRSQYPRQSSRDEINSKMQSAKTLLSSVELPSDSNQTMQNEPVSLTDRYLKTLATLAETTDHSVFRTSLPHNANKNEQNFRQTRWTPIVPNPETPKVSRNLKPKVPRNQGNSREGSVYSYDDVGAKSLRYLDLDTKGLNHSYMDLGGSLYGSQGSMLYDDVKAPSVHTYISMSNRSCSTDMLHQLSSLRRSVSEDNLSLLRYELVETSSLVTARPAIVREDQLDSLSYVYDDVGANSLYNCQDGPGLYESIAGSILNLARTKMGFDATSVENLYASLTKTSASQKTAALAGLGEGDEDCSSMPGPHEVLTYTLEKWSAAHWSETRALSSARSSNRSSERKSVISDKSDEWIDLEDEDEYENSPNPRNQIFARSSFRVSNRKKWANSSNRLRRRQWNQALLESSKPIQTHPDSDTYYEESSPNRDGASTAEEDLYESIYEVIRPPSESDFEEIHTEIDESRNKSIDGPSLTPGLSKLAEAAGKKMRKLRRNWSLKKNDFSRSLSRIRKYSSGGRPVPVPQQSNVTVGTSIPVRETPGLRKKPSRRSPSFWLPDAKSVVRQHGGPVVGDGSPGDTTFYITLTIEQDEEDEEEDEETNGETGDSKYYEGGSSSAIETDSRSQTISMSSSSMQSGSSKTPDTSWTASTLSETSRSSVPIPPRRKSNKQVYSVVRPTEAPPAPPAVPKGPVKPQHLSFNLSPNQPDSLLLCDSIREYSQQTPTASPFLGSPCSEEDGSTGSDLMSTLRDHLEETYTSSLFQTEPLYQFYDKDLTESQEEVGIRTSVGGIATYESRESCDEPLTGPPTENMYECIDHDNLDNNHYPLHNNNNNNSCKVDMSTKNIDEKRPEPPPTRRRKKMTSRPSAMDLIQASSSPGGRRSMWAELPEVLDSGILTTISPDRKKLQEAMFEVITSEASYLKSLNILIWHFAQSSRLIGEPPFTGGGVIGKRDHRILFSDVIAVRQCSEKFLEDLEKQWQSSVLLNGLCEIVRQHAENNFQVYVKYCSNQVYQDRILKKLRSENPKFMEVLRELESSPVCQSLAMHSFLMLPMQRITRLPLLLDAIFNRLNSDSQEYLPCKEALHTLNKLVKECNESARNMERMEEMLILSQQLDFREVKAVPLISASRWLVKRGDAVRIWWKDNAEAKLTFGRRVNRQNHCFFLFTDLLVIGKKKSDESYLVVDYCPRNLVQMSELENSEGILPGGKTLPDVHSYLAWLTLLQNNDNKTIEWLVAFSSECERRRWTEAVTPQTSENPEEKIYEEWDCPLVEAIKPFHARESDELALEQGEKANVLRKLSDSGWYYVERRSDGGKGWVPMSVTREIESNHVRARNYKQRYAFLKLLASDEPAPQPPMASE